MYVKFLKPLNPNAEEWRPIPPPPLLRPHHLLPHLISHPPAAPPPPPHAVEVVAVTPAPPPKIFTQLPPQHLYYYYSHPRPSHHYFLPHHMYKQPRTFSHAYQYSHKAAEAGPPICGGEMNLQPENVKSEKEEKMAESPSKTRKSPRINVSANGVKRAVPPRLRRALGTSPVEKKSPPPPPLPLPKQVWKKKKSENTDVEVSGDGGPFLPQPPILPLPPPSSAYSSHSSNTTVMIKNIPNQLRRDFMLKFLDGYCKVYSLEYDFLYLPMDFRKKGNLGYAFVNFTTAAAAIKFKNILHNYKWEVFYSEGRTFISKKVCEISWARIQGKEGQIRRFYNSNFICDEPDFLPVILDPPRDGSDLNPPPPVIIGNLYGSKIR